MIHALGTYLTREVWHRRRELVADSQLWIALGLSVAAAVYGPGSDLGDAARSGIIAAVLAYAAIAFGFALAGLTVAITVPDQEFTERLATEELAERDSARGILGSRGRRRDRMIARRANAYLDLLFVFSWTAFVHWLVIAWSLGIFAACGTGGDLLADGASAADRAGVAGLVFVLVYAAQQFLAALLTLSAVGRVYVADLRRRASRRAGGSEPESPPESRRREPT